MMVLGSDDFTADLCSSTLASSHLFWFAMASEHCAVKVSINEDVTDNAISTT